MHLLIDSDSLCYKAGFVCNEPHQEALACSQLDTLMEGILKNAAPETYQCYLTGSNNFRYQVYDRYKANRKDTPRPIHLEALKAHLIGEWGATLCHGIEADDAVGIAQTNGEDTCIAHIDKDIDMIPGLHYNYNRGELYSISNEQAWKNFLWQILLGDRVDNIPGYDGKMRASFPKFMLPIVDDVEEALEIGPTEGLIAVLENVQIEEWPQLLHCLWIQREEEDSWLNHVNKNLLSAYLTEEGGRWVGLIPSLQVPSVPHLADGLQSMSV